ncbi:MAG: sulfurtransferase TusA family protein [Oscillospiraceae bacterium]
MSKTIVDARGLSCPEPVLLAQNALKQYANQVFTVAVSSATARDNVSELLQKKGKTIDVEETGGEWFITAT